VGSGAKRGRADQPPRWPTRSFLARLDGPARDALLRLGTPRRYEPEETLLREGEHTGQVLLLLSGWVKVTAVTGSGHEALLAVRVNGDIVGELAALDEQPRSATVTACGPVVAREIRGDQFRRFLAERPPSAMVTAMAVGEKLRTATRRRVELSGYNVRERLIRVLAELSRDYGQDTGRGRLIGVKLTQPELAAAVGAAEASVHNALRELREQGLLDTGYRQVIVLRPDDLDEMAR
jgi:CRP/FNR family cyclic AMP-dependent transcriptional regulator